MIPTEVAGSSHGSLDERLLAFARKQLGPHSERRLSEPEHRERARRAVEGGASIEDAVLFVVHGLVGRDPRVADEFTALFLLDLQQMGKLTMTASSRLRRFLDTGDLVHSVFGDMWPDFLDLKFESRNQFRALFGQRLHWKAADRARKLSAGTRREDRRVDAQPEELEVQSAETSSAPLPRSIRSEERERLILIMLRLNERDRQVLTLHLKGVSNEAVAAQLGLSKEAARKAIERAIKRAQQLAGPDRTPPALSSPRA